VASRAGDGGSDPARLTRGQLDQAALVLARAFHDYPLMTFLFPDDGRRQRALREVWRSAVRYTLLYGEVWAAPGLTGVACWLPPGQTHKTLGRLLWAGMGRLLFRLRPAELVRNVANEGYADRLHARCAPCRHWYLFAIAVEPSCQGQGVGSGLLRPMLARVDNEQMPLYLETHNLPNVALYERHRFTVVGAGRVAGSSVPVFGMLRQPVPTAEVQHEHIEPGSA
jgi:GNAT superfamily N-acetyltransferase